MYKRYLIDHTIIDTNVPPGAAYTLSTLAFLRRSGQVRRYHTERTLVDQDVAQHSYCVAWLCYILTDGHPSRDLLLAALAHDAAEHALGDIPSPTKRMLGIRDRVDAHEAAAMRHHGVFMPDLSVEDDHILKMADALDGVLYCLHERQLGNTTLKQTFQNYCAYVGQLDPTGAALQILEYAEVAYHGEE
jgi:5'-deoxynucleotidase YfbR-like HD superfamily hydrolase